MSPHTDTDDLLHELISNQTALKTIEDKLQQTKSELEGQLNYVNDYRDSTRIMLAKSIEKEILQSYDEINSVLRQIEDHSFELEQLQSEQGDLSNSQEDLQLRILHLHQEYAEKQRNLQNLQQQFNAKAEALYQVEKTLEDSYTRHYDLVERLAKIIDEDPSKSTIYSMYYPIEGVRGQIQRVIQVIKITQGISHSHNFFANISERYNSLYQWVLSLLKIVTGLMI